MSKSFDVKKYYPNMKLSSDKRGIVGSFQHFSSDSDSSSPKSDAGYISQGSSMNELKKKYFGSKKMEGGPQKDSESGVDSDSLFTEDAVEVPPTAQNADIDAQIIEPDFGEDSEESAIIGKKTIITENGEPRASQG
ncbi:MAG: hypothetical protein J0M10_03925 [Chitinophagales bacterium]|nr:hypothetical protein [Chitinophagales bacterium]